VKRLTFPLLFLFLLPTALGATASNVFRIEWQVTLQNSSFNDAEDVHAYVLILDNRSGWANQQVVWENIPGAEILRTEENRVAVFHFSRIGRGETKTVSFQQLVKVDRTEFDLSRSTGVAIPSTLLPLTRPVDYLWENHPSLVSKASELCENAATPREKLQRIFEFVKGYLFYREQTEEHGALWAYQNRVGDCTEFTNLLIALCRLSGIPAEFVSAIGYSEEKGGDFYTMGHAFALVYLPDLEWVPVDATWSSPVGELGKSSEEKLVMLTSDGSNLVKDFRVTVPKDRISYSYVGTDPRLRLLSQATISKEVGLDVKMDANPVLGEGNVWEWYVTLTNKGREELQNLRVRILADNKFLEVPEEARVDSLPARWNKTLSFELKVKQSTENLPVRAVVEYDSPYGTFSSSAESQATVTLPELPPGLEFLTKHYLLLILGMVAVIVILLARRF
jgi:transglutaminase-like putative cysteine protease